jgi:hypothetical protein
MDQQGTTQPTPGVAQPSPVNPVPTQQGIPTPLASAPQVNQNSSQGKSKSMYILIGIILLIIVFGGGTLFFMSHHSPAAQPMIAQKASPTAAPAITGVPTPVISPVTAANVDQTLDNTDSQMQQTVTQANSDLNSISNIDTSQDNTSGL